MLYHEEVDYTWGWWHYDVEGTCIPEDFMS